MSSYGLWLSASGMQVNEHRQNILANNMANINTTGFKRDLALIQQRRLESSENPAGRQYTNPIFDGLSGGLAVMPSHTSFEQGTIEKTGRPLDVAIDGQGLFTVSDGNLTRYTRDGVFTLNAAGELVLTAGEGRWRVLDDGGRPVQLERGGANVTVSGQGTVRQGDVVVAQMQLVANDNEQALRKAGENLFENQSGQMVPANGKTIGGARELSNFDMMRGLASMIAVSRAYQFNATMIQMQDHATGQAVTRVGRAV